MSSGGCYAVTDAQAAPCGVHYPPERLAVIAEREAGHFWHAPRRRLLLDTIARTFPPGHGPFLDIGCGTGALVAALLDAGHDAYGLDPWAGHRGLPPARYRSGGVERIPWSDGSFAAVGLFDVLEHVEEVPALGEVARVLRPGGLLFVSVPACAWLWGPRDVQAGHLRRYTRAGLRQTLERAGFAVQRMFGYQCALLPLLVASRLWARWHGDLAGVVQEDRPGRLANAVLRWINQGEVALPAWLRPPVGSSLGAVARCSGHSMCTGVEAHGHSAVQP